jgi:hypothetical protein
VFAPQSAAAASGRVLAGGRNETLPLVATVRPVATPASRVPRITGADAAPTLPSRSRPRVASVAPQVATGAGVRQIDAAQVSAAATSGMSQVETVQGLSHDSQGIPVSPPDTNLAASSTRVVEAVNLSLLIMNRDGGNQQVVHLSNLWNPGARELSDPRVVFDPTAGAAGRWFTSIVMYDGGLFSTTPSTVAASHSWIGLAASTDATPTTWNTYLVQSAPGVLMDQPGLGLNGDKVVSSANDFDYTHGGQWAGADVVAANKSEMVAGSALDVARTQLCAGFGLAPAFAPASATAEYAPFNNVPGALPPGCGVTQPASQSVSVVTITGLPPAAVSFTETDIAMCPSCAPNQLVNNIPAPIPQPNSSMTVDAGDDRFLNATWQGGKLWTGGSTALPGTSASGLSMFEVDTGSMTLPIADRIGSSAGESFAFPNFALDQGGTPYIAFSRGSSSRYMSSGAFAYIPSSDTLASAGVLNGGAGQGPYDCHCTGGVPPTRWGDYSGSAIDPADPNTVWVASEYSAVGDGHDSNWGTLLTRVTLHAPTAVSASPNSGYTRGGTWVTVNGDYFDENSTVYFGGVPAQVTVQQGQQRLAALTPPHRAGTVDVSVSTPTGGATLPGGFTFVLPPRSGGYWLDASDGGIFPYGNAIGYGSTGNVQLNQPMVGMAATPNGGGYWLVASDGGIFPFGNAGGYGSTGNIHLNQPIVGMAATPDGGGYWLVASDGGIFPFGNAGGYGSTGNIHLNQPIVGMAATPTGHGYWLVASDGGIFPFGDAAGWGSHGGSPLNKPIVGMAATSDGGGYWLVASDGGIFPYGDAVGWGSHGGSPLNQPIVGMAQSGDDGGYWLVASDGGIFPYGDAAGYGSHGGSPLNKPVVGMAGSQP